MMLFDVCLLAILAISPVSSSPTAVPLGPLSKPQVTMVSRVLKTWQHPGVLLDATQLSYVKSKVAAKTAPWSPAFDSMMAHSLASLTRTPSPVATVECGPTSTPDVGCTAERQDAIAAYTMSLAWYITGTQAYAAKAIQYMNAWSSTIRAHTNSNAMLQTGWSGATWARAAEIIRYTEAGWTEKDIETFETMLRDVYLPEVFGNATKYMGNWELVMMEAAISISVFLEDDTNYDKAMGTFLARVPAYIYLTTDGSYPRVPMDSGFTTPAEIETYWNGQTTFPVNGMIQETCRDLEHSGYGIASISHVAEISRIQGRDLFAEDTGTRLREALEFHSQYALGFTVPSWLCGGQLKLKLLNVTEIGYNNLAVRLGKQMPNTKQYTFNQRPGGQNGLFVAWETLSHALTSS